MSKLEIVMLFKEYIETETLANKILYTEDIHGLETKIYNMKKFKEVEKKVEKMFLDFFKEMEDE